MKRINSKNETDWERYLDVPSKESSKQRVLKECKRYNVCVYKDDESESSGGVYSEIRGVASEAELERRLNARKAMLQSNRANLVASLALVISLASLIVAILVQEAFWK